MPRIGASGFSRELSLAQLRACAVDNAYTTPMSGTIILPHYILISLKVLAIHSAKLKPIAPSLEACLIGFRILPIIP
jgi:hypothetical protein